MKIITYFLTAIFFLWPVSAIASQWEGYANSYEGFTKSVTATGETCRGIDKEGGFSPYGIELGNLSQNAVQYQHLDSSIKAQLDETLRKAKDSAGVPDTYYYLPFSSFFPSFKYEEFCKCRSEELLQKIDQITFNSANGPAVYYNHLANCYIKNSAF